MGTIRPSAVLTICQSPSEPPATASRGPQRCAGDTKGQDFPAHLTRREASGQGGVPDSRTPAFRIPATRNAGLERSTRAALVPRRPAWPDPHQSRPSPASGLASSCSRTPSAQRSSRRREARTPCLRQGHQPSRAASRRSWSPGAGTSFPHRASPAPPTHRPSADHGGDRRADLGDVPAAPEPTVPPRRLWCPALH